LKTIENLKIFLLNAPNISKNRVGLGGAKPYVNSDPRIYYRINVIFVK